MKQKTGKILVDIDVLEFKISISPIYFVDYRDVKDNLNISLFLIKGDKPHVSNLVLTFGVHLISSLHIVVP
jgi:hypothetical protein